MNSLFLVFLLAVIYPCTVYSSVAIKCLDKDTAGHETSRCTVKTIERTPWSKPTDKTAPPPNSLDVKGYTKVTDGGRRIIQLNITWSQQAYQMKRLVKAYYVVIKPIRHIGVGSLRKFNINLHGLSLKKHKMVYFNYDTYGSRRYERVHLSTREYYVGVHALPLYQPNEANRVVRTFINIPGCGSGNKEIAGTHECKSYFEQANMNQQKDSYEASGDYDWMDNSARNVNES